MPTKSRSHVVYRPKSVLDFWGPLGAVNPVINKRYDEAAYWAAASRGHTALFRARYEYEVPRNRWSVPLGRMEAEGAVRHVQRLVAIAMGREIERVNVWTRGRTPVLSRLVAEWDEYDHETASRCVRGCCGPHFVILPWWIVRVELWRVDTGLAEAEQVYARIGQAGSLADLRRQFNAAVSEWDESTRANADLMGILATEIRSREVREYREILRPEYQGTPPWFLCGPSFPRQRAWPGWADYGAYVGQVARNCFTEDERREMARLSSGWIAARKRIRYFRRSDWQAELPPELERLQAYVAAQTAAMNGRLQAAFDAELDRVQQTLTDLWAGAESAHLSVTEAEELATLRGEARALGLVQHYHPEGSYHTWETRPDVEETEAARRIATAIERLQAVLTERMGVAARGEVDALIERQRKLREAEADVTRFDWSK